MKTRIFLFLSLIALALLGAAPDANARSRVSFEFFYDSLDPYGEWIDVADYGYCWRPTGVEADWSPYTDGYWAYTDEGWTWVSYEDWGGITYHYGRWVRIEDEGWIWVPDYEWAPAWVSWRHSDEYIGWAPLPPRARFRRDVGISVWVDAEYDIGPGHYSFCEVRQFGEPALRPIIIDRSRNVTIINNTVNITNITINRRTNRVFVGGPQYEIVSARSTRPIQTLRLVRQTDPAVIRARGGRLLARQRGNDLIVPAPEVVAPVARVRPTKVARTIAAAKVDKGWDAIKDQETREKLTAKIKQETKGQTPEKDPAKPASTEELKMVEKKIKERATKGTAAAASPAVQPGASSSVEAASPAVAAKAAKNKKGQPPVEESAVTAQTAPAGSPAAGASPTTRPAGAKTTKVAKGRKGQPPAAETAVTGQPSPGESATAETSPAANAAVAAKAARGKKKDQPAQAETAVAAEPSPAIPPAAVAKDAKGKKRAPVAPETIARPEPDTISAVPQVASEKPGKARREKALSAQPTAPASAPVTEPVTRGGKKAESRLQPFADSTEQPQPPEPKIAKPGKKQRVESNVAPVDQAAALRRQQEREAVATQQAEARVRAREQQQQALEQRREQQQAAATARAERASRQAEVQQQQRAAATAQAAQAQQERREQLARAQEARREQLARAQAQAAAQAAQAQRRAAAPQVERAPAPAARIAPQPSAPPQAQPKGGKKKAKDKEEAER